MGGEILLSEMADAAAVDGRGLPDVSVATARWFRQSVGSLMVYLGGDGPAAGVRPQDVREWQQGELEKGLAPVTVNSYLRGVKTVCSRLAGRGALADNPAAGVRFLPEPPPRPKAVREADYLAMRRAADNARDRAIVDMLWASGCRLGGLSSMRVDRMEAWDEGERHCFAFLVTEKGSRGRWVYVGRDKLQGDGVHEYLLARPEASAQELFLTLVQPWRPVSSVAVEHVLMKLKRKAGIPKKRPANAHAFRHAFAARMLDEGEDLPAVSAWLGHHSPAFTAEVYVVRSERALRNKYFRPARPFARKHQE